MVEVALATKLAEFWTEKSVPGVEVPTPIFPAEFTYKRLAPVDDAILSTSFSPAVPCTESLVSGDVVPTPTLPLVMMLKARVPPFGVVAPFTSNSNPLVAPASSLVNTNCFEPLPAIQ